jgi:hypothetical protein
MARPPAHLRRLADDWPVIFAVGVAIWFAAASLGATGVSLSNGADAEATSDSETEVLSAGEDATTEATDEEPDNAPVVAGPLKIKVASFRLAADKKSPGTLEGDVVLEVRNTTKQNVSFYPSQMSLRKVGSTAPVTPKESVVIGVSPNLPVTAPVTFSVTPDPGARYQLFYGGHVIYSGLPF